MTQPPSWALVPPPEIHQPIGGQVLPGPPLSWQQIKATGEFWLNSFIGKIAIAFGGIDIAGWKPFEFLADWGQQRIADALVAYQQAMSAQNSANYANVQLTILTGGGLASNVTGGVAVSTQFAAASSNNPGGEFVQFKVDGPGGGNFGLDGNGRCVWKKSGGLWKRRLYAHATPLNTDYQAVFTIIGSAAQNTQFLGEDAHTYLLGRIKDDGSGWIYCIIGYNFVAVGDGTGGDFNSPWTSTSVTVNGGDQFSFLLGTDTDVCQFVVKQNGVPRITATHFSAYGSSHRLAGVGAKATTRDGFFNQTAPAELEMWSAADRLPATL